MIPDNIKQKIREQYPEATDWNESRSLPFVQRHAAEWGYNLREADLAAYNQSISGQNSNEDWKEKIKFYASHAYYRGAVDRVTNEASQEAFNKWFTRVVEPAIVSSLELQLRENKNVGIVGNNMGNG